MKTTPPAKVQITVDGAEVTVAAGSTLLEACRAVGSEQPTLCHRENLTPVNVCRLCVVEVEGSRALVPSCSREAEPGMIVHTDSARVRHSRKLILEFLASSADLSLAGSEAVGWIDGYGADPARFGSPGGPSSDRDRRRAGRHPTVDGRSAETVAQPAKIDNPLYVRDNSRCILCYQCVEACGLDAQNTFAIAVAGRGFDARISTEFDVPLPASACVFCGNCIGVCPTGALMFRSEYELRAESLWDETAQTVTRTVCPYCGVGCNLELHTQGNRIVKVTSPFDHDVSSGHLCIKGRFGYDYVQELGDMAATPIDAVLARARNQE